MAAIMAVGVAKTNAQGQKTTKTVTARMLSPVKIQVAKAVISAMITIQVAHLSARPTIFALLASAFFTSCTMRCIELLAPLLLARRVKAPN